MLAVLKIKLPHQIRKQLSGNNKKEEPFKKKRENKKGRKSKTATTTEGTYIVAESSQAPIYHLIMRILSNKVPSK